MNRSTIIDAAIPITVATGIAPIDCRVVHVYEGPTQPTNVIPKDVSRSKISRPKRPRMDELLSPEKGGYVKSPVKKLQGEISKFNDRSRVFWW